MPKKSALVKVQCENCGKILERYPSQIRTHVFCTLECARSFTSARTTAYNKLENPMNRSEGWTWSQKERVREREIRAKAPKDGKYKSYPKYHGRHAHRVVAEQKLGRPLIPGEIVHHEDENKANYSQDNLLVFENQSQHISYHLQKRGGALKGVIL